MLKPMTILFSMICCAGMTNTHSFAATDPFVLTISTEHPNVKSGDSIWIKVIMTNTSAFDVDCSSVSSNGIDLRYSFEVRDPNGKSISKKKSKHPELEGAGSVHLCTLRPGQSTVAQDNLLSREFDFSPPGTYTIQVSRAASDSPRNDQVKSNTLVVTVTP